MNTIHYAEAQRDIKNLITHLIKSGERIDNIANRIIDHVKTEWSAKKIYEYGEDYLHADLTRTVELCFNSSKDDNALAKTLIELIEFEWHNLMMETFNYLGAATVASEPAGKFSLSINDAKKSPLMHHTIAQLSNEIHELCKKKLDTTSRLDHIQQTADETKKNVGETRQGVAVLVQHLPDAKKPHTISWKEAVAIMKRKGGDMIERTGRNWIKAWKAAKTGTPISWDDLSTVASWSAWVDTYLAALNSRASCKKYITERAGNVESERNQRRSPTA